MNYCVAKGPVQRHIYVCVRWICCIEWCHLLCGLLCTWSHWWWTEGTMCVCCNVHIVMLQRTHCLQVHYPVSCTMGSWWFTSKSTNIANGCRMILCVCMQVTDRSPTESLVQFLLRVHRSVLLWHVQYTEPFYRVYWDLGQRQLVNRSVCVWLLRCRHASLSCLCVWPVPPQESCRFESPSLNTPTDVQLRVQFNVDVRTSKLWYSTIASACMYYFWLPWIFCS
jgi:hypothetical protein